MGLDLEEEYEIINDKIRLCSFENNSFNDIKEISIETLNSIKNDVATIKRYNKHFLNFIYFQQSLFEFDNYNKSLKNIPTISIDINKLATDQNYIRANRIVFNLLTSFKFFIDSSERHIEDHFGKGGTELLEFKKLTNHFFDNHFSYRFLDKLRNYTVHKEFPIKILPYKAKANFERPETMIGDISLIVNREDMLKEKSYLKAQVTNDITEMDHDINVSPLIYELGQIIFKIEKFIYGLHKDTLEESIENLKIFALKFKTNKNNISIIYNIRKKGKEVKADTLPIPFDKIEGIENFKNWK